MPRLLISVRVTRTERHADGRCTITGPKEWSCPLLPVGLAAGLRRVPVVVCDISAAAAPDNHGPATSASAVAVARAQEPVVPAATRTQPADGGGETSTNPVPTDSTGACSPAIHVAPPPATALSAQRNDACAHQESDSVPFPTPTSVDCDRQKSLETLYDSALKFLGQGSVSFAHPCFGFPLCHPVWQWLDLYIGPITLRDTIVHAAGAGRMRRHRNAVHTR